MERLRRRVPVLILQGTVVSSWEPLVHDGPHGFTGPTHKKGKQIPVNCERRVRTGPRR
ncbi:hypothetical protein J6590_008483 [Homalodisca vitripennis]|nr:hypothetical protein J6590_008483 [Homalodisca vitripennis]